MKKLLIVVIIVTLPSIAYFQYKDYNRFNPPVDYDYPISDSVDSYYHDQVILDEYYTKAVEIGSYARSNWNHKGIDVRFPNSEIVEEINASKYYNQLLSRVKSLEVRLKNSMKLKGEGFSNDEIKLIEAGYTKGEIRWARSKEEIQGIQFGDQSEYVWHVQKKLIESGYEHRLDGLFGLDTQNAIISFQSDNDLYPSGTINGSTFSALFLD